MAATNGTPSTLAALTSAALALPGMTDSAHAASPTERRWDVGYFLYDEGGERMTVEAVHQTLSLPLGERWDLVINGVWDAISGASPIYNLPEIHCQDGSVSTPPVLSVSGASGAGAGGGTPGTPPSRPPLGDGSCQIQSAKQVMLENTFQDIRRAADFKLTHYLGDTSLGLGAGASREKDYDSDFFSLDLRHDLNQKQTTLAFGYSLAADTFSPLNMLDFSGDKDTHQWLLGVTQILNKDALLQVNLTYSQGQGYLTDPYKQVYVLDSNQAVQERRPDERNQWNLLARWVQYFPAPRGALHLDYRYSSDDWGVHAHTLEASWVQPLSGGWRITPTLRYYSQDQADFYQSYFQSLPEDGPYSSDYRLAGFGALSGGLRLSKRVFGEGQINASIELYDRQSRFKLGDHEDSSYADYTFAVYGLSLNLPF